MPEGYCVKCKAKKEISDAVEETMKNGRKAIKGKCPTCGTVMFTALAGGAAGPWVTGTLHDIYGDYTLAFAIGIAVSALSAISIWLAAPRKVRAVAGRIHRIEKPA